MKSSISISSQTINGTTFNGAICHCTFTGKERDEETGYGYFGARYMDHELLTSWLSVDPMADKYPSISPYAYCAWNPIKLVDPDGRDWYIPKGASDPVWNKNVTEQNLPEGAKYIGKTVGWSGIHSYDMGYHFYGDINGNLTCLDYSIGRKATLKYGRPNMTRLSHYTSVVLFEAMFSSGVSEATIPSTSRTPEEQAKAMLSNLENGIHIKYQQPGKAVNDVYNKDKSHKENLMAMTKEIYRQGPNKVSRHCVSGTLENVLDLSISGPNGKEFSTIIKNDGRVSKYLSPYDNSGERCHHIQIKQP